jgi:uncharacterized protein YbjT (DUF2867 family)
MPSRRKIVVTGAAGLVGQNLLTLTDERDDLHVVAIDRHPHNTRILRELHPDVEVIEADLAEAAAWTDAFAGADTAILLHAQITGKDGTPFERNNLTATHHILDAIEAHKVPFLVHVSSSVVNSVADDHYTNTKKAQEKIVRDSGVPHCILRPTLMFGWFDPKHLGWLARFMERAPVFPIPGHGRYMRQPLYNRDFCRVVLWAVDNRPEGRTYDLVGPEEIDYVDIIRTIKRIKGLRTPIVKIPYGVFAALLRIYALFSERPPFTADQLRALTAGDRFTGVDMRAELGIEPTPFETAMRETLLDPRYSKVVLEPYV